MAKYTVELRTLIEAGFDIFDDSWDTFVPSHKAELCAKIIRRYYFNEIGSETPERFKHYINEQLARIMPYYNQLYASELMEIVPLYNYVMETDGLTAADKSHARNIASRHDINSLRNMAESIETMGTGTSKVVGNTQAKDSETWSEHDDTTRNLDHDETTSGSLTGKDATVSDEATTGKEVTSDKLSGTKDTTQKDTTSGSTSRRYSDTPQAQITASEMNIEQSYLTNYTRDTNQQTTDTTSKETLVNTDDKTVDTTGKKDTTSTTDKTESTTGKKDYTDKETIDVDKGGQSSGTASQDNTQNTDTTSTGHQFQNGSDTEKRADIGFVGEDTQDKEKVKTDSTTKGYTISQSRLLQEYRKTFLNIDAQIIAQLEENFMGVF